MLKLLSDVTIATWPLVKPAQLIRYFIYKPTQYRIYNTIRNWLLSLCHLLVIGLIGTHFPHESEWFLFSQPQL